LPAPAAAAEGSGKDWNGDEEIDWGPPSKEELIWGARTAGRDKVPKWARTVDLQGQHVEVRSYKGKELPRYLVSDAFDLTKANMEAMYLNSLWGWNEEQKRGDLESDLARFFVAFDKNGRLLGFVHYRFELIDDRFTHKLSAAAYVLELQVVPSARRAGLGSQLMKVVEEVAHRTQMDSVMLCVFRFNEPAVRFYLNKMGYAIDETSAFNFNQKDVWELVKPNNHAPMSTSAASSARLPSYYPPDPSAPSPSASDALASQAKTSKVFP
jgi:GNAT superfamily N-acetyltransferase